MMLPASYPKKPPYVRIINTNNQIVAPFYQSLRSPTDPKSFILNQKLVQCKNWNESKSIVNIVIQSQNIMRQHFPFVKDNHNSWNDYGYTQNNNNFNQYGGNNSNYGFINPNTNTNVNKSNSYNNNNVQKKPPIPFNITNTNELILNSQKFVGQSKKIVQKLKKQQAKSIQTIQFLQTIKSSLQSQEQYLRHQNIKMNNFIRNSEKSNIQDITSLIRPKDQRSQQILDITSSIRAQEDCMSLLQAKFNEGQISFDEFIRLARKIQEEKFELIISRLAYIKL